jgi:hypothetical protein
MSSGPDVLIASAFGEMGSGGSGGGVFAIDGSHAERIDPISSLGLAYDGTRLARILRCRGQYGPGTEVAVYDRCGVQRYNRLDGVASVHDVAWDGDDLVVVSTWHNAVRWFGPDGRMLREVVFDGPPDSRHLNCLTRRDGEWYATMFGPVGPFGGSSPKRAGAGRIVRLTTGETVVGGLTAPHTPRWLDGLWLVCDSAGHELLAIDEASGRVVRRVACGDFTRGLAADETFFYVGTSRGRPDQATRECAGIVVIDRSTWTQVERISVPAQAIYDLVFISPQLHDGLRRGFDVNPLRTLEFRQHRIISELGVQQPRSLWPSGDPLPWDDFHCTVTCTVPPECAAGALLEVPLRLTNCSRSFFTSVPPAPIYVSYKWLDPQTGTFLSEARAYRTPLPRTVFPGESVDLTARVVAPETTGTATLRMTAIQEGVSWFDDQDSSSGLDFSVEITPAQNAWQTAAPMVR